METQHQQIIHLVVYGSIIAVLFTSALVLFTVVFINRKEKLIKKNVEQEQAFKQTLLQTQIEIQEQTLKTISQEIHDNVGQVLSLVKLNITQAKDSEQYNENKLNNAQQLLSKAIQDLRDISKSLNTETISNIGILTALQNEIDIINKSGANFSLTVEGAQKQIAPQTQLILFRIIQECINNNIKHSNATQSSVYLFYGSTTLDITIEDNGIGFNTEAITKGQGLSNVNSRAKLIGANIYFKSQHGKGTVINICLPV